MTAPTLHYIHDPLCGWCYAVTPMVEAVAQAGIGIVLHGGGLWATAASPAPERRAYIRQSDARIAALTSMAFGPAYLDGLLTDAATVFWSRPTVGAVLAAGAWSRCRFSRKRPGRSVWRKTFPPCPPERAGGRAHCANPPVDAAAWVARLPQLRPLNVTGSWSEFSTSLSIASRTPFCAPSTPSRRLRQRPDLPRQPPSFYTLC
jgi:hypothetical protein